MNKHLEFLNAQIKRHLIEPNNELSFESGEVKLMKQDERIKKFMATRIVK